MTSTISATITPLAINVRRTILRNIVAIEQLHQYHVELLRRVQALALEPNGFTGDFLELRDAGRVLVEQPFDHARPREHQQLLEVELPVLPQDLAEDLVAYGLGGFHESTPL